MTAAATSMQLVALASISESRTNPRKHFAKEALAELTESIRAHGVLSPILVRPVGEGFELIAGARRFRAAQAAGLAEIPAVVRELDDRATLEVQVIENLQRSDLHPLEEAHGYRLLTKEHGHTVDELAAKVGKSKAYVYARLKLCDLPKGARKLFEQGKLDASRALLVARIPDAKLAEEAAQEIADGGTWHGEPMSYREAQRFVQTDYMLRLKDAPFATGDAGLVPAAGACGACPKRTGNQKGLFDDVQSADVCTDPSCFKAKVEAHWARRRPQLEAKGVRILEGKEGEQATNYGGSYHRLGEKCWDDPKNRTWKQLLKGLDVPLVVARASDGREVELVPRAAAAKAVKDAGHSFVLRGSARSGSTSKSAEEKRRALRSKAIAATVEDLVAKAEALDDEKGFLRFIVDDLLSGHAEPVRVAGNRRGLDMKLSYGRSDEGRLPAATIKAIDAMTAAQLRGLAVELIALDYANPGYGTSYGGAWQRACKLLGIDMRKREAAIAKAEPKPAKKSKAKAAAKPKKTKQRRANKTANKAAAAARRCRECGCTEDAACDGGCSWVEQDLCSACAEAAE